MAAMPEAPKLGIKAPDFSLPATDGGTYALADIMGPNGAVVVFICNHCPYVKAVTDRMVEDAKTLAAEGIGFAAISANDAIDYPADSFDNMKIFAAERGFTFPYLYDESQAVAQAYEAVCTPDFYGLNARGEIQYRGRLDEGRKEPPPPGVRRELVEAMREIARTGQGPADQRPSMGCSIKWKAAA
ncbi:MAG TPA: thioredoxin family protein [Devosiaceae bacterium]|nr:thioredoxin family protein [Devosiaceae bacterium]